MKTISRAAAACLLLALIVLYIPSVIHSEPSPSHEIVSWQFQWQPKSETGWTYETAEAAGGWIRADSSNPVPERPKAANIAWLKLELPHQAMESWNIPALFIPTLYGHHVEIFSGERQIFSSERYYLFDVYKIALPINREDLKEPVYLKITTLGDRIGIHSTIQAGDYEANLPGFYRHDLADIVLGGALIFLAVMMLVCSFLLKKTQLARWLSLSLTILTVGMLIITYSPFLYTFFGNYGRLFLLLFDVSLYLFIPMIMLFIEKTLDNARLTVLTAMRKFQIGYSSFCMGLLILNELTEARYIQLYYFFTVTVIGIIMLVQFVLLVGCTVYQAVKGNRDAQIVMTGFALFFATGIGELVWFYVQAQSYELYWWKWGVLCFIISFIIVLAKRFARDHEQVVKYSRELELYNNRLQKHEKMEIISELAASVAHEVRNPLQVTRGFLQLIGEKATGKEKEYMTLALEELDRASGIITDFLTFAKPQLEDVKVLDLAEELHRIEGILLPMANMQGCELRVTVQGELLINGNSSKLRQALVNIVKNSIEASDGQGNVDIWAYQEQQEIVLHIKDNGEGMDAKELSKLGEPYYSNKTKGTGLGLMVTFRIIEVMQGKIEFQSKKGFGTEAIVRFPAAAR